MISKKIPSRGSFKNLPIILNSQHQLINLSCQAKKLKSEDFLEGREGGRGGAEAVLSCCQGDAAELGPALASQASGPKTE